MAILLFFQGLSHPRPLPLLFFHHLLFVPPSPAPLSPSVVPALEEPLPLELAYLLFTTEGHQQTSTALEGDYLSCFGKKLSVLANHYECSVTDLIRKSTPLEVSRS